MAAISSDGKFVTGVYDTDGLPFNPEIVTSYYDGTPMTDAKVDNAIYFKGKPDIGGGYVRRKFNQFWNWFKMPGETDDAIALNRAILHAHKTGMSTIVINSSVTLMSPVLVKQGITLDFGEHDIPRFNRTTGVWTNMFGAIVYVKFGKGLSADDLANAAFSLEQGASIRNAAFNYVDQDMTALVPSSYPPAIAVLQNSLENKVCNVCFGNAYVGIDARRDHGQLKVENVNGYPLFRGIRIGGMIDNDVVRDLHFNPAYTYTGTINKDNSFVNWMYDNSICLELGRNSWSNYYNIFGYNYKRVVYAYKQVAGVTPGNTKTGGTEKGNFYNVGGDSVKGVMEFEGKTDEAGNPIALAAPTGSQSHWGVMVYNLSVVTKSAYDATKQADKGFKWNISSEATRGNVHVFGGRSHDADWDVFDFDGGIDGTVIGFDFYDFAKKIASGKGIRLNTCKRMKFIGNTAKGSMIPTALNRFVFFGANNDGIVISGNTCYDFAGACIEVQLNGNTNYQIQGNYFRAGATTDAIIDSQKDLLSVIANNSDSRTAIMAALDNDDVVTREVSPGVFRDILVLPAQGIVYNFTGTKSFQGIDGGRYNKVVFMRFSANPITITDADVAVPLAQRLELNGDFVSKQEATLCLMTNGSYWWEVARSFNTTEIRSAIRIFTASEGMTKNFNRYVYQGTVSAALTLPNRSTVNADGFFYIKNASQFVLNVARAVTDTIYDNISTTSVLLPAGGSLIIYDDGSQWVVAAKHIPGFIKIANVNALSKSTLNTSYGTYNAGFGVYAPNITTGAVLYIKLDDTNTSDWDVKTLALAV